MSAPFEVPAITRVPARQVILSAALLWLCYFALITVRGLVVELGEFNELLWRRALVTVIGIGITLLAWPLLRRFDGRSLVVRAIAALFIMFPAALAIAYVNQLAFAPVEKRMLTKISEQHGVAPEDLGKQASVQIRHDVAGNVLVDVSDENFTAPPAPPEPDVPQPAPQAAPASRAAPAPPAPPEAPGITRSPDGSTVIRRPGVVIRRFPDGSSEVRTGGMVIRTSADEEVQSVEPDEDAPAEEFVDDADPDQPGPRVLPPVPPVPGAPAARVEPAGPAAAPPAPAGKPVVRPSPSPHRSAGRGSTHPVPAPAATAPSPAPSAASDLPPARQETKQIRVIQQSVENEGLWRQLTDVALGRYFLLLAWAALYLALGNAAQVEAATRREGEHKRAAKNAELRSLRYQVNPHFLFNTLNSLSALVMSGRSEKAEQMIQTISNFYRHSLAGDPTSDVPLADEIALQRHYLEIEAVRFPERLVTVFDVPEDLEDACVPGMILQPLVENSVKYAVSATSRPVTIHISAREAGGKLILTVSDDGPGKLEGSGGTGIGLANVRDRLAARFGTEASIESSALPAGGYSTTLMIPVVRHDC